MTEGETRNFTIEVSPPTDTSVSVSLLLSGPLGRFQALPLTVIIPAGTASQTVALTTIDDSIYQGSNAAIFSLSLTPITADYSFEGPATVIDLTDDEAPPTISIADISANEIDGSVVLTVSLSHEAESTISFDWTTTNATAIAPADYIADSGSSSIPGGSLTSNITISIFNDLTDENDETFSLNLSNVTSPATGTLAASVTIVDDDLPPTLTFLNTSEFENRRSVDILIQPTPPSEKTISFNYATANGTAIAGTDYTTRTGTVTIPANTSSATLSIPISNILGTQPDRDFQINLSSPLNVDLGSATLTATILDFTPAMVPTLVKDIGIAPADLKIKVALGKVFFVNKTAAHGDELWVSDGTEGGTFLVRDINVGPTGSSITSMIEYGGFIYFGANDGVNGRELWRSDGTLGGTTLVTDIYPGLSSSSPDYFLLFSGNLLFGASDAGGSGGLFSYNGTTLTKLETVTSARPILSVGPTLYYTAGFVDDWLWKTNGTPGAATSIFNENISALYFAPGLNRLFFSGYSSSGDEPYVSDGTSGGTLMLKNIGTSSSFASSSPRGFIEVNNLVYFLTRDYAVQQFDSLYVTDGTTAGTLLLVPSTTAVTGIGPISGKLLFTATDATYGSEIWITEGTVPSTVLLKDINPGTGSSNASLLGVVNGKYMFSANDGTNGNELWSTDGTELGTTLIKDLSPAGSSAIYSFTSDGTTAWFVASNGTDGAELWKTDGTEAGTFMVKDLTPGPETSAPRNLTLFGSQLFFTAYNSAVEKANVAISDGTSPGTVFFTSTDLPTASGQISSLIEFNSKLFFAADDGNRGSQLWSSDGTSAGTEKVKDLLPGGGCVPVARFAVLGTSLFFTANQASTGTEPHVSDGTFLGTNLLKDIFSGPSESEVAYQQLALGNKIFFMGKDGVNGLEPWITDGTAVGTFLLKDINAGTAGSNPLGLSTIGSRHIFAANSATTGMELWATDGTPGGTNILSIYPGSSPGISATPGYISFNSELLFSGNSGNGFELWKTDGTPGGTSLVSEIYSGTTGSNPGPFQQLGSEVLFFASTASHGKELWKTDGTTAGTVLVKDIRPGSTGGAESMLIANSQYLFFTANDGVNGTELWRTDGTEAGTQMVKNITAGAGSTTSFQWPTIVNDKLLAAINSSQLWVSDGTESGTINIKPTEASQLTVIGKSNGYLFFSGRTGTYGDELFISDGTYKGTYLLSDLAPGSEGSYPQSIYELSNGDIFFLATDPLKGQELWKLGP